MAEKKKPGITPGSGADWGEPYQNWKKTPRRPPTLGVSPNAVSTDGVKDRAPFTQTFDAIRPTQPTAPAQVEPKRNLVHQQP